MRRALPILALVAGLLLGAGAAHVRLVPGIQQVFDPQAAPCQSFPELEAQVAEAEALLGGAVQPNP